MPDSDANTIISPAHLHKVPTPEYVKDLLGDPQTVDKPLADLSFEQRLALAQIRFAEDLSMITQYGCEAGITDRRRIERVETFVGQVKTGLLVLGSVGAIIVFVFALIEGIKNLGR